jgi:hypothetical protein
VLAVVKPGLAGPSVECKQVTTGIIEDWWGPAHDVGGPAHDDGAGGMIIGLAGIGAASGYGSGSGRRPGLKTGSKCQWRAP